MAKKKSSGLADPTKLQPIQKGSGTFQMVIETPKGSRNKWSFDAEQKIFCLKKVLPAGMAFPYDFGFVPQTLAPDGDPIDVLLLMDEPGFCGAVVPVRLIGVIEGEQVEGKKKNRNDRLLAVAQAGQLYANVQSWEDLPKRFINELEQFFVNYHRLEGKEYKLLGCKDAQKAARLIDEARHAARAQKAA